MLSTGRKIWMDFCRESGHIETGNPGHEWRRSEAAGINGNYFYMQIYRNGGADVQYYNVNGISTGWKQLDGVRKTGTDQQKR